MEIVSLKVLNQIRIVFALAAFVVEILGAMAKLTPGPLKIIWEHPEGNFAGLEFIGALLVVFSLIFTVVAVEKKLDEQEKTLSKTKDQLDRVEGAQASLLSNKGLLDSVLTTLRARDIATNLVPVRAAGKQAARLLIETAPALADECMRFVEQRTTQLTIGNTSTLLGTLNEIANKLPNGSAWLGTSHLSGRGWNNPELKPFTEAINRRARHELTVYRIYCIVRHTPLTTEHVDHIRSAIASGVHVRLYLIDANQQPPPDFTLLYEEAHAIDAHNTQPAQALALKSKLLCALTFDVHSGAFVREMRISAGDQGLRESMELFDATWRDSMVPDEIALGKNGPFVPSNAISWALSDEERDNFVARVRENSSPPKCQAKVDQFITGFVDLESEPGFIKLQKIVFQKASEYIVTIRSAAAGEVIGNYPTLVFAGPEGDAQGLKEVKQHAEDEYLLRGDGERRHVFYVLVLYENREMVIPSDYFVNARSLSAVAPVNDVRFVMVSKRRSLAANPVFEVVPEAQEQLWMLQSGTREIVGGASELVGEFAPILRSGLVADALRDAPLTDQQKTRIQTAIPLALDPAMKCFGRLVARTQNDLVFIAHDRG